MNKMNKIAFLQGYLTKEARRKPSKKSKAPSIDALTAGQSTVDHAIAGAQEKGYDYGLKGLGYGAGAGALAGGLKALLTDKIDEEGEVKKKNILDYLKSMGAGAIYGGALGGAIGGVGGAAEGGLEGAAIGAMKPVAVYNEAKKRYHNQ